MLATSPLAAATGVVAALVAILGWQVPVLSVAALLCALAGFALVWLIAYIAYQMISPDGALVLHTIFLWRLLLLEAKERRKRYGKH